MVTAVKTNVTSRRKYMTSYTTNALNTRDFLSSPGRDNMGEIRIVGPNKIRGYPYPVCKKRWSSPVSCRSGVSIGWTVSCKN